MCGTIVKNPVFCNWDQNISVKEPDEQVKDDLVVKNCKSCMTEYFGRHHECPWFLYKYCQNYEPI